MDTTSSPATQANPNTEMPTMSTDRTWFKSRRLTTSELVDAHLYEITHVLGGLANAADALGLHSLREKLRALSGCANTAKTLLTAERQERAAPAAEPALATSPTPVTGYDLGPMPGSYGLVDPAPAADTDGWIEWAGGKRPVPAGTEIGIRFRSGREMLDGADGPSLRWAHEGNGGDIVAYRVVAPVEPAPPADADGWIEWAGGECPVPDGTLIDVRYRDGEDVCEVPANEMAKSPRDASEAFWLHDGLNVDIVAYRVVDPAPKA